MVRTLSPRFLLSFFSSLTFRLMKFSVKFDYNHFIKSVQNIVCKLQTCLSSCVNRGINYENNSVTRCSNSKDFQKHCRKIFTTSLRLVVNNNMWKGEFWRMLYNFKFAVCSLICTLNFLHLRYPERNQLFHINEKQKNGRKEKTNLVEN